MEPNSPGIPKKLKGIEMVTNELDKHQIRDLHKNSSHLDDDDLEMMLSKIS